MMKDLLEVKPYLVSGNTAILCWFGGKRVLSKWIIPLIPAHKCYVEPFAGGAWVMFRKSPSPIEILNDINGELVNFYRVFQSWPGYFVNKLSYVIYSRQIFEEIKRINPLSLSCEERAWRFFLINCCAFSARDKGESQEKCSFSTGRGKISNSGRLLNLRINDRIKSWHDRLKHVVVENKIYKEVIPYYDSPDSFFYIDPPYYDHEKDYGKNIFKKEDFSQLAAILAGIRGRFLLSINDLPETREIFRDFIVKRELFARYSANNAKRVLKKELFITNY